eukprot:SM000096S24887  [mRNA]  locus=s96:305302:308399:- [translate_table: standard]
MATTRSSLVLALVLATVGIACAAPAPPPPPPPAPGLLLSAPNGRVWQFDEVTDTLVGTGSSRPLTLGVAYGQCQINLAGTTGYVSQPSQKKIALINVANAGGPVVKGSLSLPFGPQDISLSPTGRYLAACGQTAADIVVIDTTTGGILQTLLASKITGVKGFSCKSVEFCTDTRMIAIDASSSSLVSFAFDNSTKVQKFVQVGAVKTALPAKQVTCTDTLVMTIASNKASVTSFKLTTLAVISTVTIESPSPTGLVSIDLDLARSNVLVRTAAGVVFVPYVVKSGRLGTPSSTLKLPCDKVTCSDANGVGRLAVFSSNSKAYAPITTGTSSFIQIINLATVNYRKPGSEGLVYQIPLPQASSAASPQGICIQRRPVVLTLPYQLKHNPSHAKHPKHGCRAKRAGRPPSPPRAPLAPGQKGHC